MTDKEHEHASARIGIIGCIAIALIGAGYYARKVGDERDLEKAKMQITIDSLTIVSEQQQKNYTFLKDSLKGDTGERLNKIDIINEVKRTIRNEIQNQTASIYSVPDSAFQHYVDSIRAGSGFH